MTLTQTLFGFKGRIRRRDWWTWTIASTLAGTALSEVVLRTAYGDAYSITSTNGGPIIGDPVGPVILSIVLLLPTLWVQLALVAKRAHDRNIAGWAAMAISVLSIAVSYVPDLSMSVTASDALAFGVAAFLFFGAVYQLVLLGIMDGTQGPNRYGPSPKGIGGDPAETLAEVFE